MSRLFRFIAARWSSLGLLAIGHSANQIQTLVFDYVVYPAAIAWLGPVTGGAVMTAASALFSWIVIVLYRRSGRDWLGLEVLRDLRDGAESGSRWLRLTRAVLRRGRLAALILLSVRFDPFVAVLYLREGEAGRSGVSRQDWRIFWVSVLISNLYWIGVVSIALKIWAHLVELLTD